MCAFPHQKKYLSTVRCTTINYERWIPLERQERGRVTHGRPLAYSTGPSPSMHGAFTSQLLARHLQNESLELCARQIFADVLQSLREVFAHAILSALLTLQIESKGADDRLTIGHAPRLHRKYHLASHMAAEASPSAEAKGWEPVTAVLLRRMRRQQSFKQQGCSQTAASRFISFPENDR